MRAALLLIVLCGADLLSAQNLVLNPSFEDHYRCPNNFNTSSREFSIPGWRSATTGTPDYFHQCSWGDCDVPFNWAGESNAHNGLGYVGIYVWNRPTVKTNARPRSYREYIEGELKDPMIKGKRYQVEFYYKLASYSVYSVDRIGLLLTDSIISLKGDEVIQRRPQLSVVKEEPVTKAGWELATMEYVAEGGEQYLVIGNFFDNMSTQFSQLEFRKGKSPMLSGSSYFYIDDVSVILLDPDPVVVKETPKELIWPEGGEVKEDETYVLKHIQFEFDKYILLPVSYPELDRLVKILNQKPEWKAELNGHSDDVGSDEYNLELSRNRAASVGKYLESKGIAPSRLITRGYGKKQPLVVSKGDSARMLNRRVEVRFVK